MTADTQAPTTYQARFDFGSNLDPDGSQTATLKELLDEVNHESTYRGDGARAKKNLATGVKVNEKSLELTLDFIHSALGEDIQGATGPLPLSTIKTIKLLYTRNDASDTQLFRRLARPDASSATMEHWEKRNSPRNERTIRVASEIMVTIQRELSTAVIGQIDSILLTTPKLLECIQVENLEILEPIFQRHSRDDEAMSQAVLRMAKVAASFPQTDHPYGDTSTPLHERLYIYLRTLPFFHFVGEYERHIRAEEALDLAILPVLNEVNEFCKELTPWAGPDVNAHTPVTSIAQFPEFLSNHALALSKLVHQATGIKSERRDLIDIIDEVKKVLFAYVFHQSDRTDLDVVNLTVTDCIAALAAIRKQQKEKTLYTPKWVGQESGEQTVSRLLSHLDTTRSIEDLYEEDYIPQGALHILYHRFCIAYGKISGSHHGRQLAWMEFQLARLSQYAECYRHSEMTQIMHAVGGYYVFCMRGAPQVLKSNEIETA